MIYLFLVPFIALLAISIFDWFLEKGKVLNALSTEDEFTKWAFGDAYEKYQNRQLEPLKLMNAWNMLHGDIYEAKAENNVASDIKIMYHLYKKHGRK